MKWTYWACSLQLVRRCKQSREIRLIQKSSLFDYQYYRERYHHVAVAGLDPLLHFLETGAALKYNPNPLFHTAYYLERYPDVAEAGINPLVHYIRYGLAESRNPSLLFDTGYYCDQNPIVAKSGLNPLTHYLLYGKQGRRATRPTISIDRIPSKVDMVDIIIPVYRGLDQTTACIRSVLKAVQSIPHEIVVINDQSPEPELVNFLQETARTGAITLLHNSENFGFVQTVNRGMAMHPDRDVVLLNSDTEVANNWLDRLHQCAYANPRIGTVTPFSNNATICSYPRFCKSNTLLEGWDVASLDAVFARVNPGALVEIPTAVGFCMYIRRDCLEEVGLFDTDLFGKGYGEENDFCMRALRRNWCHVLAADTFVFHAGEVSFAETAESHKKAAMDTIRRLHPNYDHLVQWHIYDDPARKYRLAATVERFRQSRMPVLLYITHYHGGGAQKYIEDLFNLYRGHAQILILRPTTDGQVVLESMVGDDAFFMLFQPLNHYREVMAIILDCNISRVHINHIVGHDLGFIRRLITDLDVPFDFTIHDYYTICPRTHFRTITNEYCEEKGVDACNICIDGIGASNDDEITIEGWRMKHAWLVKEADRVIAPSRDVANRMLRYFPGSKITVAQHPFSPDLRQSHKVVCRPLREDQPLRVALLGTLAPHKGLRVLEECARHAHEMGLPLEFHLLGEIEGPQDATIESIVRVHGRYQQANVIPLLREIAPHVVWFPTRVPETFSYTLGETFEAGLPVVAPNLGSFPERLAGRPWTWLIPWNQEGREMARFFSIIRSDHFIPLKPPDVIGGPDPEKSPFYEDQYLSRSTAARARKPVDLRTDGHVSVLAVVPTTSAGEPDPCAYIRVVMPLSHHKLRERVTMRLVSERQALRYQADLLIVQRTAIPTEQSAERLITHCRLNGMKAIFETDDDLFNTPATHPEWEHYEETVRPARRFMEAADVVTVSSPNLKERLKLYHPNIRVLPNALDERLWDLASKSTQMRAATNNVSILYMGTMTHVQDLAMVEPVIRRLKREYRKRLRFEVIGVVPGESSTWYDKVEVPWPIAASYPAFVRYLLKHRRWDIGIAPLTCNAFNNAKSYIKFLDYSALGLASVLSDIEPYRQVVRHERTGLLVPDDPEAWYRALKRLIEDPILRDRCRQESYADLLRDYTLGSQAHYRFELLKSTSNSSVTHSAEPGSRAVDLLYSNFTEPKMLHSAIAGILENPSQPPAPSHMPRPARGSIVLRITDGLYRYSACRRLLTAIPAGLRDQVRNRLTT